MNRILALIILLLFLTSCASAPVITPKAEKPMGQEPDPVVIADVYWRVKDGNVCLLSTDGVKLNKQLKDTKIYVEQLQNLVCYYEPRHSFCGDDK